LSEGEVDVVDEGVGASPVDRPIFVLYDGCAVVLGPTIVKGEYLFRVL
jgi:hypothetical protein